MTKHAFEVFREKHQLTQQQLADKLLIKQARYSHYVTRRRPLPARIAQDFLRVAREHGDEFTLDDIYASSAA